MKETTDSFALSSLERLLYRGNSRQTRRQFLRLLKRHWPLSVDPNTYPRLAQFVERYTALQQGADVSASSP